MWLRVYAGNLKSTTLLLKLFLQSSRIEAKLISYKIVIINCHQGALELPENVVGFIVCYRTGPKNQDPKECILKFPNVKSLNAAAQLIGRNVAWSVEEHKIKGKIVALHGKMV